MTSAASNTPVGASITAPTIRQTVRYGPELRVLIVGGGVAGLTLAALLEQRGFAPIVVERSANSRGPEYVIGLWPAGSRVLKGLRVFPRFASAGTACTRYTVANERGDTLHSYSLAPITKKYGPLVNVFRSDLLATLRQAVSGRCIRHGTTVREIAQSPAGPVATFDDGTAELFDVVVGCDGIRSPLRQLVFGGGAMTYSGLTGWAFSVPSPFAAPPEILEYWGANKLVATYPVRQRLSVLMAVRAPANAPDPPESRADRLRSLFAEFSAPVPWLIGELARANDVYHDDFNDVDMDHWVRERVVLIGDAAHGNLPMTAMGATLAMESAAVLAEELCRTDSSVLTAALERYVARRRPRVHHIHTLSRRLGRLMFAGGRFVTRLRNRGVQLSTDELLLDELDGMLAERI